MNTYGLKEKILPTIQGFLEDHFKMSATSIIRKEAFDTNDNFIILLFGDLLGIPNPVSYYTLELLPYLAEELEGWERRMQNRKSIFAEKLGQYDFCC
ncbi:MAG: hypothetical protein ACE5IT_09285 [bacterium]